MKAIEENTVSAEGQVAVNEKIFTLGNGRKQVLIFGNSITRHGCAPELGWFRDCGMAASAEGKDYVHLLLDMLTDTRICTVQAADFEREFSETADRFAESVAARSFSPDWIVGRLGENVQSACVQNGNFAQAYKRLLDSCRREETKIILTTCFWKNPAVDDEIRKLSEMENWPLVDLNDLGERDDMKAYGLFQHSGVAAHPGDKGMCEIAKRIVQAMEERR